MTLKDRDEWTRAALSGLGRISESGCRRGLFWLPWWLHLLLMIGVVGEVCIAYYSAEKGWRSVCGLATAFAAWLVLFPQWLNEASWRKYA